MTRATGALAGGFVICILSTSGCKDGTSAPPATPATPAMLETKAASPETPATEPTCDLGIWDATVNACAIPPKDATGYPGAWAGCSMATRPQNSRCFTGTHWASCECACNGTTKWNDAKRRCE